MLYRKDETLDSKEKVLIFMGEGIGNMIQITPTIIAIHELGYTVDLAIRCNFSGYRQLFSIPEVNNIYNVHAERIGKQGYSKIILTEFGHIESYKYWKEDFDGSEVMQDPDIAKDLGKMNDTELNFRYARELGYIGEIPRAKVNFPTNEFEYFDYVICAGAGGNNKKYPYFAEVARRLKGNIAIVGGSSEKDDKFNFPNNCSNFIGKLDLYETAGLIANCGVYLGNDSGNTHLANATGAPTVMILGPTPSVRVKPWNNPIAIVTKGMKCQPCVMMVSETQCEKEQKNVECLYSLPADEVVEAALRIEKVFPYPEKNIERFWKRHHSYEPESISFLPNVLALLSEKKDIFGKTVLDFGVGMGVFNIALSKTFEKMYGYDKYPGSFNIPNNYTLITDSNELPEDVDTVFMSNTLSWLDSFKDLEKYKNKKFIIIDKFSKYNKTSYIKQKTIDMDMIKTTLPTLVEYANITMADKDVYTICYTE